MPATMASPTGGINYLRAVALGQPIETPKRVIVVGGGNTAIDCVRVALREGAEESILVYRRTRKEMPAESYEVDDAEEEGVKFEFLRNPTRLIAENGKVVGVEVVIMELGEPDESGRRRPAPKPGSEYVIPCDMVIPAIGQDPDLSYLGEEDFGIKQTRWNSIVTHGGTMMTDCEGVFAGGDCEYGAMTVVVAVGHGRRAARAMHRWLTEGKAYLDQEDAMEDLVNQLGVFDETEESSASSAACTASTSPRSAGLSGPGTTRRSNWRCPRARRSAKPNAACAATGSGWSRSTDGSLLSY